MRDMFRKITENEVKISVTAVSERKFKEKKLHVHPDLGSATQAPYVYKNYDKDSGRGRKNNKVQEKYEKFIM